MSPGTPRAPRVLARATTADGRTLAGTRDALLLDGRSLPWETLHSAEWDRETGVLRIAEVGEYGDRRPVHDFEVTTPGRLLELARERITASVVLQRHVPVHDRRGLFVVARRPPRGDGPITWFYDYEAGVDPADPVVRVAAESALADARADLGLDSGID